MRHFLAAVEPLPGPGLFPGLLDGQPWLASFVLILAGLAAFVTLRNQGRHGAAIWSLTAAFIFDAGLHAAAHFIMTDRERTAQATLELVRATAKADTAAIDPMLAPGARVIASTVIPGFVIPREGLEKREVLDEVSRYLGGTYKIDEYAVLETQAQRLGPTTGRTQVRVRTVIGYPIISWWRIDWRRTEGGQWRATLIEFLEFDRF
jgi:hypothetical protein